MVLEAHVAEFAKVCKIDPKVEEWLVEEGITDCEGVASLAAKKEMVDPKFIQMMIAEGINEMKGVRQADRTDEVLEDVVYVGTARGELFHRAVGGGATRGELSHRALAGSAGHAHGLSLETRARLVANLLLLTVQRSTDKADLVRKPKEKRLKSLSEKLPKTNS